LITLGEASLFTDIDVWGGSLLYVCECPVNTFSCYELQTSLTLVESRENVLLETSEFKTVDRQIKSRRMRWAGHVARMGEKRNANRILVGKSEGKRPL
jgi:hypothetical protein